MIDVEAVIQQVPHFETFCSVAQLHELVSDLQGDRRFDVKVLGMSKGGLPIHHVRFGSGSIKALFVGFPHCKEPICGLTVFSLMKLLHQGDPTLTAANVEWHIVPCIDPDGAKLNEGWTQKPLTLERYMRNFYVQALTDQVDGSFPLAYKGLQWSEPSPEASMLMNLLDEVLPDFYYTLHNAWTGGAFYYLSRDIDHRYHHQIYSFLDEHQFPLQRRPIWRDVCAQFGAGIIQMWSIKRHYDQLQRTIASPEKHLTFGGSSWDYLEQIKPAALTFATEMGYVRHPADESDRDTGENLRRFKLHIDAECKYLAAVLLELWERVHADLDTANPLYRALVRGGVIPGKERLNEGGRPLGMQPTRDLLFNPKYDRTMTEGDRFQACMVDGGFWYLCHSYQFVRLMKQSAQTLALEDAVERAERAFSDVLREIGRYVDFSQFKPVEYDTLAKVQLGSGLIVLNSLLQETRPGA